MSASAPSFPAPGCRVVIVDDHLAIIDLLRQLVEAVPGYRVVGQAENSVAALELCAREQPDLVVLDLVLPPTSGLSVLAQLRRAGARARILVFSGHLQPAAIQRALAAGADGIVDKVAPIEEFRMGMQAVASGRVYLCRSASEKVRNLVNRGRARPPREAALSEREKAVLQAIADGLSSKEIASRLGLSVHTVVNHRTRLMEKTGKRGVAQLSRYAADLGLVETEVVPFDLRPAPAKGP